jgi:hypothetical protein
MVATINLAHSMVLRGKPREALTIFEQELRRNPSNFEIKWLMANACLMIGDMEAAWSLRECRFSLPNANKWRMRSPSAAPMWDGHLTDKTVLLWSEQGFGDVIQMLRYVPFVTEMAKVIVEVWDPLLRLCRLSFPGVEFIGIGNIPPHDLQCSLLSLPHVFGTNLSNIPRAPYLNVGDLTRMAASKMSGHPKLGLVWDCDRRFNSGFDRFIPLGMLSTLTDAYDFLSLHPEHSGAIDFADTAALMMNLDAVVTVDTAAAHLAGALGISTIVMLSTPCDGKWMLGREDSPWYSNMRLVRQKHRGSWCGMANDVIMLLQRDHSSEHQRMLKGAS